MLGKLEPFIFSSARIKKIKQHQKKKKKKEKKNVKIKPKQIVGFWDLWFLLDCHIITVL